jgi:hypothetical protein
MATDYNRVAVTAILAEALAAQTTEGLLDELCTKACQKTAHTLPATRAPTLSRTLKASVPSSVNTQAVELLRVQSPATRPRLPSLPRTLNELDDLAPHHAPDSEEETSAPSGRTIPLLSDRDLEGSLLAVAACGKVKVALHA